MSLFYRKLQACSLVLAVGLAACSETSGPTDGFTVADASADLAAMQGAFETEAFQSLGGVTPPHPVLTDGTSLRRPNTSTLRYGCSTWRRDWTGG